MSPGPYFSPEPDPETVGTFGGYRPPSPTPQDNPPTEIAAADGDDPEQLAAVRMTPDQRRARLEAALPNPNVQAFLSTIANAEGVTYDSLLNDSVNHPRKFTDYSQFPSNDPLGTASGRYQILKKTYNYLSPKLGLDDFSPHTQDLMALQLLDENGVLDAVKRGDLDAALPVASHFWASLPKGKGKLDRNRYPGQPYKTYDQVKSTFDLYRSP